MPAAPAIVACKPNAVPSQPHSIEPNAKAPLNANW